MPNPFVHVELTTHDLPKAKQFYSALFGWQLQDMPMPDGKSYTMIDVGDGTARRPHRCVRSRSRHSVHPAAQTRPRHQT